MEVINLFLVLGAFCILLFCAAWILGALLGLAAIAWFVLMTLWEALCDTL